MNSEKLLSSFKSLFDSNKLNEATNLLQSNGEVLPDISWDLVQVIWPFFSLKMKNENFEKFQFCENAFKLAARSGKPKEMYMALLEVADRFNDSYQYRTVLSTMAEIMISLPMDRDFLENILPTFYAHIKVHVLPKVVFEGQERLAYAERDDVKDVVDASEEFVLFLEKFVIHSKSKSAIFQYTLLILEHPLVGIDCRQLDETRTPRGIKIASKVVSILAKVKSNVTKLAVDDGDEHRTAVGCLLYLILYERIGVDLLPRVYSYDFLFEFSMPFLMALLESLSNQFVIEKALLTTQALLEHVAPLSWKVHVLDTAGFTQFVEKLTHLVTYHESQDIRSLSTAILREFYLRFDREGRCMFIRCQLNTSQHDSVRGFWITQLKEELNQVAGTRSQEMYQKSNLTSLLNMILRLENGVETDLLESYHCLVSGLNLLRFILLRNCKELDAAWLQKMSENFVSPLRKGLQLSRAHYELEFKTVQSERELPVDEKQHSLSVGNLKPSTLTMKKEEKLVIIRMALTKFDMMESLLVRTEEILDKI